LVEKKGVAYALEAVAQVAKRIPGLSYRIIGDGPLRAELEHRAISLGLRDHVHFEGAKSHERVVEALKTCDVMLTPSITSSDGDEEGIPNVLKEAMACGLPVIATKHGGIEELISDGEQGFLVEERDSPALGSKIEAIWNRPDRGREMGVRGRLRVLERFDIEVLSRELKAIYEEVARPEK
jgi:colanic acid/amylovoran biosynthesis glycosyltransferase